MKFNLADTLHPTPIDELLSRLDALTRAKTSLESFGYSEQWKNAFDPECIIVGMCGVGPSLEAGIVEGLKSTVGKIIAFIKKIIENIFDRLTGNKKRLDTIKEAFKPFNGVDIDKVRDYARSKKVQKEFIPYDVLKTRQDNVMELAKSVMLAFFQTVRDNQEPDVEHIKVSVEKAGATLNPKTLDITFPELPKPVVVGSVLDNAVKFSEVNYDDIQLGLSKMESGLNAIKQEIANIRATEDTNPDNMKYAVAYAQLTASIVAEHNKLVNQMAKVAMAVVSEANDYKMSLSAN